jgi:hypothetical protein
MRMRRFSIVLQFPQPHALGAAPGITFRSAFGLALRRVTCTEPDGRCRDCPRSSRCPWIAVFETPARKDNPVIRGVDRIPHPFVSAPLFTGRAMIIMEMCVMASGLDHLPWIIAALDAMQDMGLGGRHDRFVIERMEELLPDGTRVTVPAGAPPGSCGAFTLGDFVDYRLDGFSRDSLEVSCVTPLRVKHQGRLVRDLHFSVFYRACTRRVKMLSLAAGAEWDCPENRGDVESITSESCWQENGHYSSRQKASFQLGGVTGRIIYRGVPAECLPAVFAGEILGIGKNTSFGLGRYRVS